MSINQDRARASLTYMITQLGAEEAAARLVDPTNHDGVLECLVALEGDLAAFSVQLGDAAPAEVKAKLDGLVAALVEFRSDSVIGPTLRFHDGQGLDL